MVEREDVTPLAKIIPAKYLPDKMRVIPNPVPLVEDFIGDLVGLLHTGDMQVRDIVREALGTELSPRLYGRLIRNMEESVVIHSCYCVLSDCAFQCSTQTGRRIRINY